MNQRPEATPFFDADLTCEECGARGMRQVEGGGGVTVWQCLRCRAEQTWGQQGDGTWLRLARADGGEDD